MRRGAWVALALCAASPWYAAARAPTRSAHTERARPTHVPRPMAVGRVRIEVRGSRALVTTDLTIPRAPETCEDLDVHVGYGAPGAPTALDAQILATPPGYLVAPIEASGAALAHEWAPRAPAWAAVVLGRASMGGHVVHLTARAIAAAQHETGRATLRVRAVHELGGQLADGTREIVVRLGSAGEETLALALVEVASDVPMRRVEARYCGLEGESEELFVAGTGRAGHAPPLLRRRAGDDLCVRFGER